MKSGLAPRGAPTQPARSPGWRCLIRLGHRWRKSYSHGTPFLLCTRCGKEGEWDYAFVEMLRRPLDL
jgi:hypothetical protein